MKSKVLFKRSRITPTTTTTTTHRVDVGMSIGTDRYRVLSYRCVVLENHMYSFLVLLSLYPCVVVCVGGWSDDLSSLVLPVAHDYC